MKIESGTPHEWSDDTVTRGLRDIYAPPRDSSYWARLESRIMARIANAGEPREWWSFFDGWVRVGLAAAVLAGVLAGSVVVRERQVEERLAYEAVMESASVIPVAGPTLANGSGRSAREATLRSIIY